MKKQVKLMAVAVTMLVGAMANAQITTTTHADLNKKSTAADVVRLIDNKGTIKYLQSINGITQITSTSSGHETTTTWQLGGELNANTYIDANGNHFALDGIPLQAANAAAANPANPTERGLMDGSDHGTASLPTGWTFLVRDEVTGETRKMLAADALQVKGGRNEQTIAAANVGAANITYSDTTIPTDIYKVWVYRNGALLRAGTDYTVASGGTPVTTTVTITANSTVPQDWAFALNDIVEIRWVR